VRLDLIAGGSFQQCFTYRVMLPKGLFPVVWFPLVTAVRISYSDKIKQSQNDLHEKNKLKAHVSLRHSVAKSEQEPQG